MKPKYLFGDIVVVDNDLIGVVVKTWERPENHFVYEVYVRSYNIIEEYEQKKIERYRVRHKELNEEELEYQKH